MPERRENGSWNQEFFNPKWHMRGIQTKETSKTGCAVLPRSQLTGLKHRRLTQSNQLGKEEAAWVQGTQRLLPRLLLGRRPRLGLGQLRLEGRLPVPQPPSLLLCPLQLALG